jgi:hypothetical protein
MAHKATHAIEPTYLVWNDFQQDKNRALVDDALPTTHPIWSPVATPSEAIEMFDVITYQKGCAVMRMLENFLGEERFEAGLGRGSVETSRGRLGLAGRRADEELGGAAGLPDRRALARRRKPPRARAAPLLLEPTRRVRK